MVLQHLGSQRGTKLWYSGDFSLTLRFKNLSGFDDLDWRNIWMINHHKIGSLRKLNAHIDFHGEMVIAPHSYFMIINLLERSIIFSLEGIAAIETLQVIYDPYQYETEAHETLDPDQVAQNYSSIPANYVNILPKWYSVKFSYADYNLIFLKPGLGISFQTHKLRTEYWEILQGHPIVVTGNSVHYDIRKGVKIAIEQGNIHTIINPSSTEWVLLKEKYDGIFDEADIVRLFNPNHYTV